MRNFINLIQEGVIALPPKLLSNVKEAVFTRIIWRMRDSAKDDEIYGAKSLLEQVYECCLFYKILLPDMPCPKLIDGTEKIKISFDISDLPDNYPKISNYRFLNIYIDWKNKFSESDAHVLGAYNSDLHSLMFYLSEYKPKNMVHKNALIALLRKLDEIIEHELRHALQFGLFGDNSEQTKLNKNYLSDIGKYYTSPVEFDPQIGTAIKEFIEYYNKNKPKNLSDAIRRYIGMAVTTNNEPVIKRFILGKETLRPSDFFHYLKILTPKI